MKSINLTTISIWENKIDRSENDINSGENEINRPKNKVFSDGKELEQVSIYFERVENDSDVEQNEVNQVGNNNINLKRNGFESNNFLDWLPLEILEKIF